MVITTKVDITNPDRPEIQDHHPETVTIQPWVMAVFQEVQTVQR